MILCNTIYMIISKWYWNSSNSFRLHGDVVLSIGLSIAVRDDVSALQDMRASELCMPETLASQQWQVAPFHLWFVSRANIQLAIQTLNLEKQNVIVHSLQPWSTDGRLQSTDNNSWTRFQVCGSTLVPRRLQPQAWKRCQAENKFMLNQFSLIDIGLPEWILGTWVTLPNKTLNRYIAFMPVKQHCKHVQSRYAIYFHKVELKSFQNGCLEAYSRSTAKRTPHSYSIWAALTFDRWWPWSSKVVLALHLATVKSYTKDGC